VPAVPREPVVPAAPVVLGAPGPDSPPIWDQRRERASSTTEVEVQEGAPTSSMAAHAVPEDDKMEEAALALLSGQMA